MFAVGWSNKSMYVSKLSWGHTVAVFQELVRKQGSMGWMPSQKLLVRKQGFLRRWGVLRAEVAKTASRPCGTLVKEQGGVDIYAL